MNVSYFVHPIPLMAVALMAFNDHYLKWHFPSWWTGKLSDFAGIFFFPLFICAFINTVKYYLGCRSAWITRKQLLLAIVLTDVIFAGIKLNQSLANLYVAFVSLFGIRAMVAPDLTDLLALGMNIFTWKFARSFLEGSEGAKVHVADELSVIPTRKDEVFR